MLWEINSIMIQREGSQQKQVKFPQEKIADLIYLSRKVQFEK
uniref:Uncharacterized protein n=1 Tax=Lepeophtheirus salmonis TaxID=72036 RepID=A0A0K2V6M0_LEPSM